VYRYECRVDVLIEEELENRLGPVNYCKRRSVLDKFDEWKDWGTAPFPGDRWGLKEIKEKRHGMIRTPRHFIRTLSAVLAFTAEELKKDPNFRPPDSLLELLARLKPLVGQIRPIVEARLKEKRRRSDAQAFTPADA
jgi:hypothetical protein